MKLGVLVGFMIYYVCVALAFHFGGAYLGDSTTNIDLSGVGSPYNGTELSGTPSENYDTSVSDSLKSVGRFFGFVVFGIGLPSDTPDWFAFMFSMFQTCMSGLFVAFLIGFIRGG